MPVTVGGRTAEPHCGTASGSGDLPAPGSGRGMGFVLIAVLALVVDREPGVASGLLAHATRLEGAGGAVVTRDRTAADMGDVGFRHIPLNGRGRLPIPAGAARPGGTPPPAGAGGQGPFRGTSDSRPCATRPRSRRPART